MTDKQLKAYGEIVAALEHTAGLAPSLVAKLLMNPADQAYGHAVTEALRKAAQNGDDVVGSRLSDLMYDAGDLTMPTPAERGVIQTAYYKAKAAGRDDIRKTFGERVKALRKAKGLTTESLAAVTGLQQPNISRIESGKYNVTLDTIGRLSDVLGDILRL